MLRRGDAVAAAANLNYCLDLIVQLLFAVNCSPVPDVKWRFHRVTNLPWLPKQFQATYPAFIINASLDSNELRRRIDIITDWVHQSREHADRIIRLPADLYAAVLGQSELYGAR
jgi:hypothetical protein